MSNIEGRNSIEFYGFKRQSVAIPPFVILRFEILLFCGSLFGHVESHTRVQDSAQPLAAEAVSLIERGGII
jgi:hypothetical protein